MEENKTFQQMVLELGINMEKNETCTLYHVKKKKSNLKWTIRLIGKPKYVKSMPLLGENIWESLQPWSSQKIL